MTPQLQQAIRMLQLSTLDLQNEVQQVLESNPMLEADGETAEIDEPTDQNENNKLSENNELCLPQGTSNHQDINSESTPPTASSESLTEDNWSQEIPRDLPVDTSWDDVYQINTSSGPTNTNDDNSEDFDGNRDTSDSLQDHLLWQLNLTPFSDSDYSIALTIIDDIQDSGLLFSSIEDIYQSLSQQLDDLELDEVKAVLHRLQQFDPPGIAAEDLADCLLIQLNQLSELTPSLDVAKTIIKDHIALLGAKDYKALMRKLRVSEDELGQAISLIQTMNPRPGDDLSVRETEYVVPDVFVNKKDCRWVVELNPDTTPKLRINASYASLVKRANTSSDNAFLKNNLQEARWFLKSLRSRNETLLKVASAIVEKQQQFLDFGEEAMKPLVLCDIADIVDMHESTISRVTNNKYIHTPQGTLELKYFFSSHVSTDGGGECSSTAIRAIIKKIIADENRRKPLSDSKITLLLGNQGIKVARRTIAKYREAMNIPPSNERKQLA